MSKKIGDFLRQAEKLQMELKKAQDGLAERTVEASAGGGMVTVVANGKQEIVSIKIDPEVVSKDDVEMLQDLILAAVNEARERAQELAMTELAKITGGMNLPGLM
ncbi:MAG TPA: YbaB/EbfC family nucleoid-associated protein [bacterium]|nr:YbaB/EbfC family nucleoid-associated protein [bacterium]